MVKNRWRERFDGSLPPDWTPTRSVSIVIPVHDTPTLPLTLASIAAQDYPEQLIEVIVVDDGSREPLDLGPVVPPNLRVVRVEGAEWGRSHAAHVGALAATGDILYWVDADMVLFRDNVREHAKWSHFIPEAATIGSKGFVADWSYTPEDVHRRVRDGSISDAHRDAGEHWIEEVFRRTDDLNASDGRNYSTFTGASASVPRDLYERAGGLDPALKLGEDTELAYRLWQAGAVFIPARDARSWHLGASTMQKAGELVKHVNDVSFAQRMPIPRYRRRGADHVWQVPFLHVVIEADEANADYARTCADRVLASTLRDVHISMVGPWASLGDGRRRILEDPQLELRLTEEWFRSDPRVRLVEEVPPSVFPAPYRLDLPARMGLAVDSLDRLLRRIDESRVASIEVHAPSGGHRAVLRDSAAVARARGAEASWLEWLAEHWGAEIVTADDVGVDLLTADDLDASIDRTSPRLAELQAKVGWLRDRAERAEAALAAVGAARPRSLRERVAGRLRRMRPVR